MTEELKPCPFCGSDNTKIEDGGDYRGYFVYCFDCDATGPESPSIEGAANAWNKRASPWISVEDGLPYGFNEVLCVNKEVPEGYWIDYLDHCIETGTDYFVNDNNATHWMPIPEVE